MSWPDDPARRQRIVEALAAAGKPMTALEICAAIGDPPGFIHPTLARLEGSGQVTSEWEILPPGELRPRRRYYRLSGGAS